MIYLCFLYPDYPVYPVKKMFLYVELGKAFSQMKDGLSHMIFHCFRGYAEALSNLFIGKVFEAMKGKDFTATGG